jgi:structural maintenance of chromosome 4
MEQRSEPSGAREPVARLMITKMVLENFKSYAGEQEIGPFHKRFSSVVGPNGSGKSNVIDALLFVFGKRAKQLRLNKVSELIHKSSRFPDLDYARVSVCFQLILDDEADDDAYSVVPGSEFSVTRIAYQNNQSKYSVDGKSSTYTEVGLVLRQYGIDLDNNRFLILQGEVEQIAMMKPKAASPHEEGLLEYLEDIIGSNKFVEQIETLSGAVDTLNEQRVDKVNRVKIAEREKEGLAGPMKEAQAFLEQEADIRSHQNILYQYYIYEASKNEKDATEKAGEIKEKLDYERKKLTDTKKQCAEMEKVYKSTNAEYDILYEEMQRTAEEFTAYERKDCKAIEDMKHAQQQRTKLESAIAKEAKKEKDSAAEQAGLTKKLETLRADIAGAEARKAEEEAALEEIMQGLSGATAALREELETVQGGLADADRRVASLQTEKEGFETSVQLQKARAATAAKTLAANQCKLDKLSAEQASFTTRMQAIQGESEAAGATIAQAEDEVSQLKVLETRLQGEIRAGVAGVEDARAALQQGPSGRAPETVEYLLKATRKGGPLAGAGVHGRLGDLGSIPAEYDLAVCLATGMLDAIVVDTAEAAQRCVSYVRDKGRVSCIVLKELQNTAAKMDSPPAGLPAGAKRLFDLITPASAAVRPAFYMALRDTLVVKDLDAAVAAAYEGGRARWRVITLDGACRVSLMNDIIVLCCA